MKTKSGYQPDAGDERVYLRVRLNSEISRKDMLLLALMSSEKRAAASLVTPLSRWLQSLY